MKSNTIQRIKMKRTLFFPMVCWYAANLQEYVVGWT